MASPLRAILRGVSSWTAAVVIVASLVACKSKPRDGHSSVVQTDAMAPLPSDLDLQVGTVIEKRYKVVRWLGVTPAVTVVEVVHLHAPTKAGKIRVLITTRADATPDQQKAFRDAGMREINLGQDGKGNLPVDEVDSLGGVRRTFVISSLVQAELDDLLAGRRVIGR